MHMRRMQCRCCIECVRMYFVAACVCHARRSVGANAVVNVRFSTSSVAQGAAELFAYGTAVRVE